MPTLQASGTQTATIGTEHTLADISAAGTFCLSVSTKNLTDGDLLELRVYIIMLTGGSREVRYKYSYADAQTPDDQIKTFPPVENDLTDTGSVRFTLKQTLGTGRNFDWKVVAL